MFSAFLSVYALVVLRSQRHHRLELQTEDCHACVSCGGRGQKRSPRKERQYIDRVVANDLIPSARFALLLKKA
jgi:hypothetical protein